MEVRVGLIGTKQLRLAALAASTAMAILLPGVARAETEAESNAESESRSGTIIVTGMREEQTGAGTKTATRLMSTAQTITVMDSEELIRRNALSVNQAVGYVAGVAANQRGGMVTRYDQFLVRGFTPGTFLDGMVVLAGPLMMSM
jgi:iron complex outermembrane receptor protein